MKFKEVHIKCHACAENMKLILRAPNRFHPEIAKFACRHCKSKYILAFKLGRGLQEKQCLMDIVKFEISEDGQRARDERIKNATPRIVSPREADLDAPKTRQT
jgi:hypothetical protein